MFYRVVYAIGAVKHIVLEVGMACGRVQYQGEKEAVNLAKMDDAIEAARL